MDLRMTLALAAVGALGACDQAVSSPPGVAITVAPLDLPAVTDAVYTVSVRNGDGDLVFTRQIDSSGYGAGDGSASYLGPCDADSNDNVVSLTIDRLYAGGAQLGTDAYEDPGTLERRFTCVADADVAVGFDLTLVRPARQGFFDVAVTFDDIFCSAKLDCTDGDGHPISLLHDASGARATTLVLGLACTTGAVGDRVFLYRDDVQFACDAGTVTLDPDGDGNLHASHFTGATGLLFGAQVARGAQSFAFDEEYWNVMLGVGDGATGCSLTTEAAASRDLWPQYATPSGTSYPFIRWDHVPITDASGALVCTRHPVDGSPGGVATAYASLDAPRSFDHMYNSGVVPLVGDGVAGAPRLWADGTAASSCLDYFDPPAGHAYAGPIGDGVYLIDPDGPSGAGAPYEATCDMTGGGWTLVAHEDFESATSGWSWTNTITTCGSLGHILGGYGVQAGGYTVKTYAWSAALSHTEARLDLDFVKIDSWDFEDAYVNFTEPPADPASGTYWTQTLWGGDGAQICGANSAYWYESSYPVELTIPHTSSSAAVRASASLDSGATDESWGLDNVFVWVR